MNIQRSCRFACIGALAVGVMIASAAPAAAQGFISPFAGYDFGGDAGCPQISGCQDKNIDSGVSFGKMNDVVGFEEEIGYARDFFGQASGLKSSVLTAMSNLMIVPKFGPVRPYVLGGLGLVKTHVEFSPSGILNSTNNNLGWDAGGGVIVMFGRHVGVRGDIRYLHAFQDLKALGFTLGDAKLDFGRASGALEFQF